MKNPGKYGQLTDGAWDFDMAMDYMFSFWTVTPLSPEHPKVKRMLGATRAHILSIVHIHVIPIYRNLIYPNPNLSELDLP